MVSFIAGMVKFIVGMTLSMSSMNKTIGNMILLICYNIFPSILCKMNLTILKFGLEIFHQKCPVSAFSHFEILTINWHMVILQT